MTTAFTPASTCSGPFNVGFGRYYEEPLDGNTTSTTKILDIYGSPCVNSIASFDGCIPSGSVIASEYSAYAKTHSGIPRRQYTLPYYSPGLVCPLDYSTVGIATKSTGGAVSSSGPAFVPPSDWQVEYGLNEITPNVLLQNLYEGEHVILCCPRFACCIYIYLSDFNPMTLESLLTVNLKRLYRGHQWAMHIHHTNLFYSL